MTSLAPEKARADTTTIATQRPVAIACSGLGHVRRGNETWARTAAEALSAAGEPVRLLGGGPLPDIRCPYQQVWNIPRDWFGWRHLLNWGRRYAYEQQSFARALTWQLRKPTPEIIHTADPVLAYRLAQSAPRLNYQVVYSDGLLLGSDWCKRFDWVHVLAPYYLEQAVAAGIDTRHWFVIPHFIRLDRFQPCADRLAARHRLFGNCISANALVVLAVGDFSTEGNKRLDWIAAEIARLGPTAEIHLVLCGQATPSQEQQVRMASADLGGRLHLFPNVAPERMPELFQAADVFAHAALREPFGIVLIEALASGLPVVGHRFPVTQWIIGDGGVSVDMTARGELAAVLTLWKENPSVRLELSRAARSGRCRFFVRTHRASISGNVREHPPSRPLAKQVTTGQEMASSETPSSTLSREDSRVLELDGLRGLAILLVIIWHYFAVIYTPEARTWFGYLHVLTRMTWSGVDLFFVLSGYLISTNLLATRERSSYFRTFYTRHCARILPLYFAVLGMHAILTAPDVKAALGTVGDNFDASMSHWVFLTFTQNIAMAVQNRFADGALSVTWSLAVEEQFYLLLPLTIWLVPRRLIPWFAAGCVALAVLVRNVAFYQNGESAGLSCYVLLPTRCDSLFLGVIVGWLFAWPGRREQFLRWRKSLWLALGIFGIGMGWMTLTARGVIMSPFITTVGYTLAGWFYATLLVLVLVERHSFLNWLLRTGWLCRLGVLSFGIYLFHEAVVHAMRSAFADFGFALPALLALAATLVLAECSWRWLESPFIAWARGIRYDAPRPKEQALAAATKNA